MNEEKAFVQSSWNRPLFPGHFPDQPVSHTKMGWGCDGLTAHNGLHSERAHSARESRSGRSRPDTGLAGSITKVFFFCNVVARQRVTIAAERIIGLNP